MAGASRTSGSTDNAERDLIPGRVRRLAQQHLFENYQIADDKLAGREWFSDHFTAADAHFFWCFRRGTQFNLDVAQFKNCMARPSARKLLAYEQEVQTTFAQAA